MHSEENHYGAPTADLDFREQEDDQPTDEMIDSIMQAGKWAKYVSYAALLGVILLGLILLPIIIFLVRVPLYGVIVLLPVVGLLYVVWMIYTITKQYARLARHLDTSIDAAGDIASCFELHTRFIKLLALFILLTFTLGFIAGFANRIS